MNACMHGKQGCFGIGKARKRASFRKVNCSSDSLSVDALEEIHQQDFVNTSPSDQRL